MPIVITNSSGYGVKTFIRAPKDADLTVDNCVLYNGEQFLDLYEPGTLHSLGLPTTVTKADLRDFVEQLKAEKPVSQADVENVIAKSGLSKWITDAGKITQVASGVLQLLKSGFDLFR